MIHFLRLRSLIAISERLRPYYRSPLLPLVGFTFCDWRKCSSIISWNIIYCIMHRQKRHSLVRKEHDQKMLMSIRATFWHNMNPSQRGLWSAAWGQCINFNGITGKTIIKIEDLVVSLSGGSKA